jgi:hypothetical protein
MRQGSIIFVASLLASLGNAMPDPTPVFFDAFDSDGWTPAPTAAVQIELAKRQTINDLTVCGYVSGLAGE